MALGRVIVLSILLAGAGSGVRAQSIFTIAGGADLDGRPATAFPLTTVLDVAVDRQGNLYVVDGDSFRVRKVAAGTGILSTVAGNGTDGSAGDGGPATAAALEPFGVAVDRQGNLFIVDAQFFQQSVRRVDATTGVITTVAGGGTLLGDDIPATQRKLTSPEDIAVDSSGNLYIAEFSGILRVDASNGRIRGVAGTQDASAGIGDGGPATGSRMPYTKDVAIDEARGLMYIADRWNHRVRRVNLSTGIIDTLAGGGSSSGDGVPATSVSFGTVDAVAVAPNGDVFVADWLAHRVWRIEIASGLIRRYAGSGGQGFSGDGGPATSAQLYAPSGLATDSSGRLLIADSKNGRVRRVAAGTITTVAGAGTGGFSFVGDGGPATAATLFTSSTGSLFEFNGLALDGRGRLYIADTDNHRIRSLDLGSGVIATVVGDGREGLPAEGLAVESPLRWPAGVAADAEGNLFFSDTNVVYRVDAASGVLRRYAGGGSEGDGAPATRAGLSRPQGLAVDRDGNLFIAEEGRHRVRKVDAASGIISTYAGNGADGRSGDGAAATAASVGTPTGVALLQNGDLYIAQLRQNVIRRVSASSGTISTVVGRGWPFYEGDGKPATSLGMGQVAGVGVDAEGNLFFSEPGGSRVHMVRSSDRILRTIAGQREELYDFLPTYAGDNGPASAASLGKPEGVAVSPEGDLYLLDTNSNRVRVIYKCRTVTVPPLVSPSNGSSGVFSDARLQWSPVPGAFRYDVLLDRVNPPSKIAAADVTATSMSLANLEPATTYYWQVVAKGDPFCTPPSSARSEVRSFTVASGCRTPLGPQP